MTNLNRRSFIAAAAIAPLASPTLASPYDEEQHADHLLEIAEMTGLSLDDLYHWFRNIDDAAMAEIKNNIQNTPIRKWSYQATYTAVMAIKAGEIFHDLTDPNQAYCVRQVRLKGDEVAIQKVVGFYTKNQSIAPALMEYA